MSRTARWDSVQIPQSIVYNGPGYKDAEQADWSLKGKLGGGGEGCVNIFGNDVLNFPYFCISAWLQALSGHSVSGTHTY